MGDSRTTVGGSRESRVAKLFASPASVLIILPALVIAVGFTVLMLGRRATRESSEGLARTQLELQADEVRKDVKFAFGQAEPVLSSLKLLAEPALPTQDAALRMRDVVIGRPGIANATIVFPVGVMWGTYTDRVSGELRVQETRAAEKMETDYRFVNGEAQKVDELKSTYDPIARPQYQEAVKQGKRVWMPPRTFESSHRTGITVVEPVYAADKQLTAVLIVDYDVGELSKFVSKSALAGARTVLFTPDGTILAYPSAAIPETAMKERRLLNYSDFHEPALDALFAKLKEAPLGDESQRFMRIESATGAYLASVAVVNKGRNSVVPLESYLATLVPESTLLAPMRKLDRTSILASSAAVAIALGAALMFAWNLVRIKRAVGVARAAAKSAEERAAQLGSYRLVERLGQGGMGEVWRAEHQLLARNAAIKLVRREVLSDPGHADYVHERFRREAQTLASLRSRHTIELFDYGVTDDGSFFFVMELLDGMDLAQLVRQHGPQPAARVIKLLAQACQSLAEAHDAGLLHRDIKPANLFTCRAADEVDILKLLDFGIVHNIAEPIEEPRAMPGRATLSGQSGERLTTEGVVIGTPGYIPPEQAIGAQLDARGDLYALACVGWWLLVGDEVYPRRSGDDAVLQAHVTEPVPILSDKVRGWMPQELEDVIVQCLAKDPRDRPANARALAEMLYAIEIPPEHAWGRQKSAAWWKRFAPEPTKVSEAATARGVLVKASDAPETQSGPTAAGTPQGVSRSSADMQT
ncbi:MAG TPA: serine/threonine protein kinase, partial [Kofleriaceae bacterium]